MLDDNAAVQPLSMAAGTIWPIVAVFLDKIDYS